MGYREIARSANLERRRWFVLFYEGILIDGVILSVVGRVMDVRVGLVFAGYIRERSSLL